jgi:small subunit ribosomal protein S17
MPEDPETTGDPQEAVEQVGDAPAGEAGDERSEAGTSADDSAPAEPETPKTPKERRAARRNAAVAKRGPRRARTPEERDAERKRKAEERRRYRARVKARRADQPKATPPEPKAEKTGSPKVRLGTVVSDKADKTITVRIDVARRHRRYQKTIRSSTTLHAHDERNEAGIGDTVRVIESRPLSRTKRWRLTDVLEKAK